MGPSFGVSDTIGSYNEPCISSTRLNYSLNVLPFLRAAISAGPHPGGYTQHRGLHLTHLTPPLSTAAGSDMDHDLSHWAVGGFYIGTGLQGSVVHTMRVWDVDIVQG